jgi:hypothetical protein
MGCTSSRSVTESQFVALEGYLAGSRRELNLRFKDRVTILHDQKHVCLSLEYGFSLKTIY